jgi:hypothetical protein
MDFMMQAEEPDLVKSPEFVSLFNRVRKTRSNEYDPHA